jgi:hypothetical protein
MPTHHPRRRRNSASLPFLFLPLRDYSKSSMEMSFSPSCVSRLRSAFFFSRAQVVIDLGASPLDGEADWYTLTSHEESLQILVSPIPFSPFSTWALWTICRRLQPRLASPIRNPTRRIWATGRKAVVAAAAAAALGAVAVAEWVAHFYHPPVIAEEPWSAVSAVTEPQSAAWAAVPGIVPCVVSLSVCPACVCLSCVCVVCVCVCTVPSGVHVCPNSS